MTRTKPRPDPAESLSSLASAIAAYASDRMNVQPLELTEVAGLHGAVLLDALFLMNKAVHVLSAAQVHVETGMCSWSLSSAYQSAFFAMKACVALLGVAVAEINSNTYVIDLCTESITSKRTSKFTPPKIIRVMKIQRVEHRQYWGMFQRLLRVAPPRSDLMTADIRSRLTHLTYTDFAAQRNTLHYGNTSWILDDLQEIVTDPSFGGDTKGILSGDALDSDRTDFSVSLAICLVRFGCKLLEDLAAVSNAVGEELSYIRRWMSSAPNHLYLASFPQSAA